MWKQSPVHDAQRKLKVVLQGHPESSMLEKFAAQLLGGLLDVPLAVAKSGFQHGGDAGTAGRHGRRLRIECKKYSDTTKLSDREMLGEIDHALARDPALEAWFLVATRSVPEQLAQDLVQKGERIGVPVVIIDWRDHELAPLAALCASDPSLVESALSAEAAALARTLVPESADAITMLRRELQSWCLGFEALRNSSHQKLEHIWSCPRTSNADLGQDAAGGARTKRIQRQPPSNALHTWWSGNGRSDAPAAIIGLDGVGKTWATMDWLVGTQRELPIVLIVPSSAVANLTSVSESSVKRLLAERLLELTGVRNSEHWLRRLDYVLNRPADEGPVLAVLFDGLNQEPSVNWLQLLKVLQGQRFAGRIRVMISTRTHHFRDKLAGLRGLVVPPEVIQVDIYDDTPGGELDQMLALERLTRADLHPDLLQLARKPRLFTLVTRLRDRLVGVKAVTVHRLLWEYGRDSLGDRAARSFSEADWQAWLKVIAAKHRDGVRTYSLQTLGETAARLDLSHGEVYQRLSDIVDGQFMVHDASGDLQPSPAIVAHALGAALIARLESGGSASFESLSAVIAAWQDPIEGLDQSAEILRAAASILVERGGPETRGAMGAIVTAWLQCQNVTDAHRRELAALAPEIPEGLLDAVEHSPGSAQASARHWAVSALRSIPRSNRAFRATTIARLRLWFSRISRDVTLGPDANPQIESHRAKRLTSKIGVDAPGAITVVGVSCQLVDRADRVLHAMAPALLEGFPLAECLQVFEVAAVGFAIRGRGENWDGLKWLCLLNEVDPEQAAMALRELSASVKVRQPEPGVCRELPARVASLLLRLSGYECDEDAAADLEPGLDRSLSYEKDYLPNPGGSLFALELRHADAALNNAALPLHRRVEKAVKLLLDPSYLPPEGFVAEVRALGASIDVSTLDLSSGVSREDHWYEAIEPVLARVAPDILQDVVQRKLRSASSCPVESYYWRAIRSAEHLLLADEAEQQAARTLRLSISDPDKSNALWAATELLLLELRDFEALAQFKRLIDADLGAIFIRVAEVLRTPTSDDVDALVATYGKGSAKQQSDLLCLLSLFAITVSDTAWTWLSNFAGSEDERLRALAFEVLAHTDAARFGRFLEIRNWSWSTDAHFCINHFGSDALIEATRAVPFDQVAPRLAPWRLLYAARVRGMVRGEVRLAANMLGRVLTGQNLEEPDPGVELFVQYDNEKSSSILISAAPRADPSTADDPMAALAAAMDVKARQEANRRASETAVRRIRSTQKSGASVYLANFDDADFAPVIRFAADMVAEWLEGLDGLTVEFRRRVHLAETAYLALCEALMAGEPENGVRLWRALRATLRTRFTGLADVDALLHMVFRAPESPAVVQLRDELVGLRHCNSDQTLLDLAIAACANGRRDWLDTFIKADLASRFAWRRRRGVTLAGFTVGNTLPVKDAWPEGEVKTTHLAMTHKSAQRRSREASAHHWWHVFLTASTAADAYAAWILFLRAADRRAWAWMRDDAQREKATSALFTLKMGHAELNKAEIKKQMKRREDRLDKQFLGRDIVDDLGPWAEFPTPA